MSKESDTNNGEPIELMDGSLMFDSKDLFLTWLVANISNVNEGTFYTTASGKVIFEQTGVDLCAS